MRPSKHTSHQLLKSINQQKVLHLIFAEGPISRVELTHKTGLSQQTVTNIVNRLLEENIVMEGEDLMPLEAGSGRKRVPLAFNSSNYYSLGLELASKYIRGCIYNFRQERVARTEIQTNRYESSDHLLQQLNAVIDELLKQVRERGKIKGIGISVQGLVDSRQGILLRAPGLGFQHIPLKQMLEEKYAMPVYIENDANLLAVNENMSGCLSDSMNNITLKLDYGIGGAIVSDKQLVSGSTFVAGEFGHYKAFSGSDAYPCHCGGTGCITTLASISGLAATKNYTLAMFEQGVRNGDESIVRLYALVVDAVALAISNIVTFLNPDRVLLTGRVLHTFGEALISELRGKVMSNVPITSRGVQILYMEHIPDETELAAGLVLKRVFEIPLDTLSL